MLSLVRFFIHIYQCTFSPLLTLICGPGSGCRFTPTCSAYFLEAIETHGVAHGTWLGLKRLGQCHPWGGCGHDPVPVPEREWRNLAARGDKQAGKANRRSPTPLAAQTGSLCSSVCE